MVLPVTCDLMVDNELSRTVEACFEVDIHSRSFLGNLLAVNPAARIINTLTVPRTLVVSAVRAGPSMLDLDGVCACVAPRHAGTVRRRIFDMYAQPTERAAHEEPQELAIGSHGYGVPMFPCPMSLPRGIACVTVRARCSHHWHT